MPVAQQPSQQHHHHLFSAIGTFLHARHPSPNPNSNASQGIAPVSSAVSGGHACGPDVPLLYKAFESHLTQRLSSLLPTEDPSCFSLSSFNEFMGLLLATQTDLKPLIPASHAQRRTMDEFLERSIKVLDVCRDIKEQITDVESLQGMLQMVAPCLLSKQGIAVNQGKISRARKILAQLLFQMEVEKGDDSHHQAQIRQSFRGRLRERLSGHSSREGSPQRWRSWHSHQDLTVSPSHGNNSASVPHALASSRNVSASSGHGQAPSLHVSTSPGQNPAWHGNHASHAVHTGGNFHSHAPEVIRALQALELSLLPPKFAARDQEECFSAAIYALNVLSVFVLGTITAAFPNLGIKAHVIAAIHPPISFGWSAAFLRLQEKVQEELRVRSKKRFVHAGMWELDVLSSLVKRLLELTSPECFPWSEENEEEVKRLVSQFDDHVHELERELAAFNEQVTEFYSRIVSARLEVFELMSHATGE